MAKNNELTKSNYQNRNSMKPNDKTVSMLINSGVNVDYGSQAQLACDDDAHCKLASFTTHLK